jgi:hypothetical protein
VKSEFEIEKALVLFTECLEKNGNSSSHSGASLNSFSSFTTSLGLSNLPSISQSQQSGSNENNTALKKQISGLILYHRERCRDYKRGHCFCMKFDDSLNANRLIVEETKRQWESRKIRGGVGAGQH